MGGGEFSRHRHVLAALSPVPIAQEDGWAPGAVRTDAENQAPPTGIRSLDRPARSESQYQLSYRGPLVNAEGYEISPPILMYCIKPFSFRQR